MTSSSDIDWAEIRTKLPFERTEEQKAKRKDLFTQFDPNGNGILSLAEVSKIFITINIQFILFVGLYRFKYSYMDYYILDGKRNT